ncbi:uncharacterized protein LOC123004098 [Tribolium madens]|uniref:uncharacterized protein LOC123004098 n=1 Tax=Tribolium madens TaxID=41895 RepID=UPI001CF73A7A|nr:uncharacterized protein LOC123004098 [Tribolium madens]
MRLVFVFLLAFTLNFSNALKCPTCVGKKCADQETVPFKECHHHGLNPIESDVLPKYGCLEYQYIKNGETVDVKRCAKINFQKNACDDMKKRVEIKNCSVKPSPSPSPNSKSELFHSW